MLYSRASRDESWRYVGVMERRAKLRGWMKRACLIGAVATGLLMLAALVSFGDVAVGQAVGPRTRPADTWMLSLGLSKKRLTVSNFWGPQVQQVWTSLEQGDSDQATGWQMYTRFAWRNQLTSWRMENLRPRIERGPSHVILSIPTIPIFAAFALAWAAVHLRDRRMVSNPCPRCQYSLAGLPPGAACPECGHVVLG